MIAQTLTPVQSPLTLEDRTTIAGVLSWDLCRTIHPEEVVSIKVEDGWVNVLLVNGCVPIHKSAFKTILKAQSSEAPVTSDSSDPATVDVAPIESVALLARSGWIEDLNNTVYRQTAWLVTEASGQQYLVHHDTRGLVECPCQKHNQSQCDHIKTVEEEIREIEAYREMSWQYDSQIKGGF